MPKNNTPMQRSYPKQHLLAASGIAALLCLSLLVYPSREVEAKRTFINIELEESIPAQVHDVPLQQLEQLPPTNLTVDADLTTDTAQALADDTEPTGATLEDSLAEVDTFEYQKSFTVSSGDTLSVLFNKAGLNNSLLHSILSANKDAQHFTQLKVGQVLTFTFDDDQTLQSISSPINSLETIYLEKQPEADNDFFAFRKETATTQVTEQFAHGTIEGALFSATNKAGVPYSLALNMASIFEYDIDFAQDLRKGDQFELIYETKTLDGETVGTGNILTARFTNRGKTYTAVRYTDKQGNSSYYNADGSSLRKAFIRTPVDFARISSRYSTGRKHPILNTIRAHKGVDYAAPRGTPIKATGDGRVISAGRKGGYGNTIVIKHGKRYKTLYAHMQGFAKGIRSGSTVKQGQIIGYIGTTGLSTGPHLHYEFLVNGTHVDPLSHKLPAADPIDPSEKQRFVEYSKPLLAKLDLYKETMLAQNTETE